VKHDEPLKLDAPVPMKVDEPVDTSVPSIPAASEPSARGLWVWLVGGAMIAIILMLVRPRPSPRTD
jgi:hypothetical protein